jgi:uncharacterized protein YbaP (TraB family)
MRIIVLFSVTLLFLVAAPLQAQQDKDAPLANSLLWEITGKGLEKPSYVFGTIHMIDREHYFLTDAAKEAFDKVYNVTFEIDMEEMTDLGTLMPLMMKAFMRGDTTLRDLLSEEKYTLVSNHFQEIGLPMMFVERIKPMFLSALASGDMSDPTAQQDIVSYEMELMEMAQDKEKEIMGLETAEYQMSMFDSIPYRVQADMLVASIQDQSGGSEQMERMIELYTTQNIEGMQSLMEEDQDVLDYQDLLLVTRNRNWIPVMEKRMADGPSFFAVGAGHLAGAEGVLRLLVEAGYTIKPLF